MLHINREELDKAITVLQGGGVIVFPTETSYGLGCDATNDKAVARIFAIKGRPLGKGLPLIIPDKAEASQFVRLSERARQLAEAFWPGPLNIIAPTVSGSPISERCGQNGTQSIRVTSHPVAATIVRRLGKPLVATSANVSGQDAIYSVGAVQDVFKEMKDKPDAVIDGGVIPRVPASTTVLVEGDDVTVLRQGSVDVSSL